MFVVERKFVIVSVQFMNDDDDLNREVQGLIDRVEQNNIYFAELLNKLYFLSDEQSIDILKITLKRRKTSKSTQIKIQANGIFFVDSESFEDESEKLIKFIGRNQYIDD